MLGLCQPLLLSPQTSCASSQCKNQTGRSRIPCRAGLEQCRAGSVMLRGSHSPASCTAQVLPGFWHSSLAAVTLQTRPAAPCLPSPLQVCSALSKRVAVCPRTNEEPSTALTTWRRTLCGEGMWTGQSVFQGTSIQPPVFQQAQALRWHQHLFFLVSVPGAAPRAARSPGAPENGIYCKQGCY